MLLADLVQHTISRHPRLALLAEAIEDTAADVADALGAHVVTPATLRTAGLIDGAFDVLDTVLAAIDRVRDMPRVAAERAAIIDELPIRLAVLEVQVAGIEMQRATRDVSEMAATLPATLLQLRNAVDARRDDARFAQLDERLRTLEAACDREGE